MLQFVWGHLSRKQTVIVQMNWLKMADFTNEITYWMRRRMVHPLTWHSWEWRWLWGARPGRQVSRRSKPQRARGRSNLRLTLLTRLTEDSASLSQSWWSFSCQVEQSSLDFNVTYFVSLNFHFLAGLLLNWIIAKFVWSEVCSHHAPFWRIFIRMDMKCWVCM